jgi:diguanylate cyclase (GGDEF)-like protein/PAS domain S-box-containing protein
MKFHLHKIRVFVFSAILLAAVVWVFVNSQVDNNKHNQRLTLLIQIQQKTAKLVERILLVETGELQNFDEISDLENQLAIAVSNLEPNANALADEVNYILNLVTQIKATYAVYRNSLLYFPNGAQSLMATLRQAKQAALATKISRLNKDILLFSAYGKSSVNLEKLIEEIHHIEQLIPQLPQSLSDNVKQLLRHADVFIQYTDTLKKLNSRLLNNQLSTLSQQHMEEIGKQFQRQLDKAAIVRQLFFGAIFLLVPVILWIWLIQQKTLKTLNRNIKSLHLANQSARQGLFRIDFQKDTIVFSDDCARLLEYPATEFIQTLADYIHNIHPEDSASVVEMLNKSRNSGESFKVEYRIQTLSGRWLWFYSNGEITTKDRRNNPHIMIGIHADITRRKQGEEVLRMLAETGSTSSEQLFRKIVRQLAITYNIRYAMITLLNSDDSELADVLISMDDKILEKKAYPLKNTPCEKLIKENQGFFPDQLQQRFPDYPELAVMKAESFLGVQLKNSQGKVIGAISMLDDKPIINSPLTKMLLQSIATRISMELERLKALEKLELSTHVFTDTQEGITITDTKGNILDVNPAFCRITGYRREEVIGQNPRILNSGKQDRQFYVDMWETLNQQGYWKGEIWNRKKDGSLFAELLTISGVKNAQGEITHYIGIFLDITDNKEQQQRLEFMAHYDVLTRLPNRVLFYDRFVQAMAHCKREGSLLAICFLDLDNFKPVNDRYGHNIGDKLLIEVAERIKLNIREEDTVSRQGGDEFTLLLSGFKHFNPCQQIIERILDALSQPFLIEGNKIQISASLGITIYPKDNSDIDTLLRHADQAMYQAKLLGKNCYRLFNAELDQQQTAKQKQLADIKRALENQEFCLFYQPKVNMGTGLVYGAEALIRWQHPEKGLIPPIKFLPVIDETPLEIQLGEWVINQALKQMLQWQQQGLLLQVSVNIASYHLRSKGFTQRLEKILEDYPSINSNYLEIEILESSALGDVETMSLIVKTCQDELGVKVALDDFGTGYSSLTHLRNLPADTVKIDQTFVRDILDDYNDCNIADGIVGLAASFNREVIAEGVETIDHGLMLLTLGCRNAQGYGIARPMPADELPAWIKNYRANRQWLDYAQHLRTKQQERIIQLQLLISRWFDRFETCLQSNPPEKPHWPMMDRRRCSCGNWIKRANNEALFDKAWLANLEQAHDKMHQIANSLKKIYISQGVKAVQQELKQLEAVKAEIERLLQHVNA